MPQTAAKKASMQGTALDRLRRAVWGVEEDDAEVPIRAELFSVERLAEHAGWLAQHHHVQPASKLLFNDPQERPLVCLIDPPIGPHLRF